MPASKLSAALKSIDWNQHVVEFLNDATIVSSFANANLRIAIWSRQFETADVGNPALSFVRGMQAAGQQVPVLTALALYAVAASAMRAMLDAALYYSFFRTHPAELSTLVRDESYFIDKKVMIEFHKKHTLEFQMCQHKLGLISRFDKWYSMTSAVIHGQMPGLWMPHKSVSDIKPCSKTRKLVTDAFLEGEEILHRLFLCTVGKQLWDSFSFSAKKKLLLGLPGDQKDILGLDSA